MKNGRYSFKRTGVRLQELADRLGLDRAYVSCIVQGARPTPPGFAARVAEALAASRIGFQPRAERPGRGVACDTW